MLTRYQNVIGKHKYQYYKHNLYFYVKAALSLIKNDELMPPLKAIYYS